MYYKGYAARETGTKRRLPVVPADNKRVRVIIPAGYEGSLEVRFESPWYWRVSEMISLMSIPVIFTVIRRERKGRKIPCVSSIQ